MLVQPHQGGSGGFLLLVMKLGAEKTTQLPRSCRYRVGTWAWALRAHACSQAVPPARTAPSGANSGLRMQLRRPLKLAGIDAAGVDLRTSTVLSLDPGRKCPTASQPPRRAHAKKGAGLPRSGQGSSGPHTWPTGGLAKGCLLPGDPGWARGSGSQGRRPGEAVAWEDHMAAAMGRRCAPLNNLSRLDLIW